MPKVTFHHAAGPAEVLNVRPDISLMRAAVDNGATGVIGQCGGQAMGATCHVYVRDPAPAALPAMSETEDDMLAATQHYVPDAAPVLVVLLLARSWER